MKRLSPRLFFLLLFSLSACATSDFRSAQEMVRQQKFYNAIEYYISFVRKHPNHQRAPEALFEVGRLQQRMLNEFEKAVATYRKLVSTYAINQYTLKAQQRIAEIHKNQFGDFRQAIIEYEKLIQSDPENANAPQYQFEIAQSYTALHNYDQAGREFKTLIEKYKKFEKLDQVYLEMGNNAYIAGRYPEALSAYEYVLGTFPKSSHRIQAVFGLASTYEELDEFDKARERYEAIKNTYPAPKVVEIRLKRLSERQKKKVGLAKGSTMRVQ